MTSLDTTLAHSEWSRSPTRTRSETCLNPTKTFSETELRAAQPSVHRRCNRRLNAAASRGPRRKYFRWGKAMRPRKQDGKLNRHGLGARRVALLAPRGVLNKYRHPLGYEGAITKIFGKVQKSVPHFGSRELYSEWGRSPGGEEGVSYSHVRGRQLVFFYEHAEPSFVASPNTTRTLTECSDHTQTPSFWAQKEAKTARGCFPSPPLATRKLLIPPTNVIFRTS